MSNAFSLFECMIVCVIIGILMLAAIPSYQYQMASQRRHQAILTLMHMAHTLEMHRLTAGGHYPRVSIDDLKPSTPGQGYRYVITVLTPNRFILSAEPDAHQHSLTSNETCKTLWVNQAGQHCW